MLNLFTIVGRLKDNVVEVIKDGEKIYEVEIIVPRNYTNEDGTIETDTVPVELRGNVGEQTLKYCEKGSIMGIKGRLARGYDNTLTAIAEKVTFLGSRKEDTDEKK